VSVTVDWRERHKLLKLRFPVNVKLMKVTREVPYGVMEDFANGDELPMQSWVDVSGTARDNETRYGLAILNDGKYSLDVYVRDVGLTVLRSPVYAHHLPDQPVPEREYPVIDQGLQHFRYTLLPHAGSWEQAEVVQHAAELNHAPIALFGTYHPGGNLPASQAHLAVEPASVIVTAIKQAEDNADLVVRAFETTRTATHATLRLLFLGRTIEADFGPGEIKTWRVPRDAALPVVETNLLEWTE
jgi:alpha-mannosidase